MNGKVIFCKCCKGARIVYNGKGRPREYCDRCRPWVIAEQRKERNNKYKQTKNGKNKQRKSVRIYYKKHRDAKLDYNEHYYETHKERHARLRAEKFNRHYHRRRYHRIQGRKRAQRKTRLRPERQTFMRGYLKGYHKDKREKYHKRGTGNISGKLARNRFNRPDWKREAEIVENERIRLGLRK